MQTEHTKKHVVIIGSGFGGIYTAKHLRPLVAAGDIEITLINKTNYFLFTPLLHEVATGGLSSTSVIEPVREIFRTDAEGDVHFVQDEVMSIDPSMKEVKTKTQTFPYDYLVVSSGAETNYYGTPGAQENTMTLKNIEDASVIRKHLLDACSEASEMQDIEKRKHHLSCIVVGAGPTGVELVAEIVELMHETLCSYYKMCGFVKEHMNISLVAASPDVLPMFPPALRIISQNELTRKGVHVMTNMKVTGVEKEKIIFSDGTSLEAHTIIWVAGVKPLALEIAGSEKEKSGRIKIDEFLRIATSTASTDPKLQSIYSLGDVSGTAPMLAQVAKQQGKTVAMNIAASIASSPLSPFIYKEKGLLVSLGQWYAAGKIYGVTMKGPLMWWIWRTIYLFNFQSWRKRIKIAMEWTAGLFYPRDISEIHEK